MKPCHVVCTLFVFCVFQSLKFYSNHRFYFTHTPRTALPRLLNHAPLTSQRLWYLFGAIHLDLGYLQLQIRRLQVNLLDHLEPIQKHIDLAIAFEAVLRHFEDVVHLRLLVLHILHLLELAHQSVQPVVKLLHAP
jgi:hypothetical protein